MTPISCLCDTNLRPPAAEPYRVRREQSSWRAQGSGGDAYQSSVRSHLGSSPIGVQSLLFSSRLGNDPSGVLKSCFGEVQVVPVDLDLSCERAAMLVQ